MLVVSAPDFYILWPDESIPPRDTDTDVHLIRPDDYNEWVEYRETTENPVNLHRFTAACGKGLDVDMGRAQPLEDYAQEAVPERLAEVRRYQGEEPETMDLTSLLMGDRRNLCGACALEAGNVYLDWDRVTLHTMEIELP